MLDSKRKFRLIALFVFLLILTLYCCYFINVSRYPSNFSIFLIIVTSFFVSFLFHKIKDTKYSELVISIFNIVLPYDTKTGNSLNEAQIKYKKMDDYIRSRPILYYFVVLLIYILVLTFVFYLSYLSIQLLK
ncbi:MAG: hypothetical protein WAV11_01160 [Minisyncoccia bacterium]